jgi:F-type H+-transporting ATPase subunit epsilon
MAETLQVEIVTPERKLVSETTSAILIPGKDGYLTVLPGHAPLITELAVGEIAYRNSGELHRLAVAWGFAEVLPDRVVIMAETAAHAKEIDIAKAQREKADAEEKLRSAGSDKEAYDQANAQLQYAENLIEVGNGPGSLANLVP